MRRETFEDFWEHKSPREQQRYKDDLYVDHNGFLSQKRQTLYVEANCLSDNTLGPFVTYAMHMCDEWQIVSLGNPTENQNSLFCLCGWGYWYAGRLSKKKQRKLVEKYPYYKGWFNGI